jgi:hypothetical protein
LLSVVASCTAESVAEPTPQPAVQAAIAEVVEAIVVADGGAPTDPIAAMADRLQQLTEGDRESLLFQLVLYLAGHPGNEPAMGAALLIDYYGFTAAEKIGGLTPHLGTDDGRLQDAIWEVLSTVDHPQGVRESVERVRQLEQLLPRSESGASGESGSTRRGIDELSRDELWWIRLYAAHVVRTYPKLGSSGVTDRLRADADSRVRHAAGG